MSPRTVVVWRHGQTAWNANRRFQGGADIDLDDAGRAQAARAARLLAALAPSAIISSDLARARETADALASVTGLSVTLDKRLREIDVGAWSGLTFDEVSAQFAPDADWANDVDLRRGGAESLAEVGDRAMECVRESLAVLPAGATLVVATHGACGRTIIASLIGLPTSSWRALGSLANCSWSILRETPTGWRLAEHNAGTLPEPVVGDDV